LRKEYTTDDWTIVRNYAEFCKAIDENIGKITHISYDHDLAAIHYDPSTWREGFKYEEETGLDCAKYMKKRYDEAGIPYPIMYCHSMNPVGKQNIINLFK